SSTTNSTGDFIINNISPGTYYAIFTKPMGYIFVTTIGLVDDLGKTSCFTLTPGEVKINLNAPLIDLKNISLEKSVNLTKAQIGDELTYTIKIANKGILPVENLKLIDKIPKGTQFIKSSITLEGISIANVDLEAGLNITTIGINETLMITFKVKIIENSLLPWQIKNIAKIIYNGNIKETPPVVTTIEKSSIGNLVWKDLNSNGIQNNHESGISGVLVNLYLSNNPIVPIKSLLTNSNGEYLFDNLRSDNYIVEVIAPEGYAFTIKNAGDDSNINSKVNIDTGRTNIITLTENEQKLNIDAGLIPLSSLEGVVWLDINENGIQDNNEPGIKDIEVTLYYCSNNIKTNYMATTD
ncbi:MAG: SdrD B-like domain-containing protein, partial [Sarcina sp.]